MRPINIDFRDPVYQRVAALLKAVDRLFTGVSKNYYQMKNSLPVNRLSS